MVRLLLTIGLLAIVLMFYALFDALRAEETRGVPKWVWVLVVLLLPVVGAVLWLVLGKIRDRGDGRGRRVPGEAPDRPGGTPRDVAPDDDPEFLRGLDRGRRPRGRNEPGGE